MSKQPFIQAVKYVTGKGWIACEPHQARMWEARLGARLIGRYETKWRAVETCEQTLKRNLGLARSYGLGTRMAPMPANVGCYAISLTKAQHSAGALAPKPEQ